MGRGSSAKESVQDRLFQELRSFAERSGIEVRCEKLARDLGYKVRSGGCTVKGKKWVIVDKTLPAGDRLDLLADEVRGAVDEKLEIPANLQPFF